MYGTVNSTRVSGLVEKLSEDCQGWVMECICPSQVGIFLLIPGSVLTVSWMMSRHIGDIKTEFIMEFNLYPAVWQGIAAGPAGYFGSNCKTMRTFYQQTLAPLIMVRFRCFHLSVVHAHRDRQIVARSPSN